MCVSRGEVEAPRILLKQLVEDKSYGVDRYVLVLYIMACLDQGQPLEQVMKELNTDIGLSYSPQVPVYVCISVCVYLSLSVGATEVVQ